MHAWCLCIYTLDLKHLPHSFNAQAINFNLVSHQSLITMLQSYKAPNLLTALAWYLKEATLSGFEHSISNDKSIQDFLKVIIFIINSEFYSEILRSAKRLQCHSISFSRNQHVCVQYISILPIFVVYYTCNIEKLGAGLGMRL